MPKGVKRQANGGEYKRIEFFHGHPIFQAAYFFLASSVSGALPCSHHDAHAEPARLVGAGEWRVHEVLGQKPDLRFVRADHIAHK